MQLQSVDARLLCLQAYDKWRWLLLRAQINLTTDMPVNPVFVMADALYLQRLLTIVIENAGKYTHAGGSVRLALQLEEDCVRIEVRDTGIGIPDQDRTRIFQRFCRGSNVQETQAHGSGLGWALAAWIAERHGTSIVVESVPGAGSSFSWNLLFAPEYDWDKSIVDASAKNGSFSVASQQSVAG